MKRARRNPQLTPAVFGKPGKKKAKARPGHTAVGEMNRTEERFSKQLEARRLAGEIDAWHFEPFKLRLGNDWKTTYSPDFLVVGNDGRMELIDVKGGAGWEEDARVKIKTAARLYPMFYFVGYTWKGKRWHREDFTR